MTARVLVVDDNLPNVRLLEAKLAAEYFEVVTAMNGVDALEAVERSSPDIILLDVMMPGIDGIEVCKRIKANPLTLHIPVVMVTALDQPEDRVRGLEAGADDFLTKPVNDIALFSRVRSLVRLKMLTDELRHRSVSAGSLGLSGLDLLQSSSTQGRVLIVENRASQAERMRAALASIHQVTIAENQQAALDLANGQPEPFELFVVNLDMEGVDTLRLCSQFKSLERTRQTPILIVVGPDDQPRLLRALDIGVNDYLVRPIDRQEFIARVNTQVRRCRYAEQLRLSVQSSMELAVRDPLTGLFNRRYMEICLAGLIENSVMQGRPVSILAIDVDNFKPVNDSHGHAVGDQVLQELAARMKLTVRGSDISCRTGGEEFVVVLPDTEIDTAEKIGERIRMSVSAERFNVGIEGGLGITISVGVACHKGAGGSVGELLKRADEALYQGKREGRNRVVLAGD